MPHDVIRDLLAFERRLTSMEQRTDTLLRPTHHDYRPDKEHIS